MPRHTRAHSRSKHSRAHIRQQAARYRDLRFNKARHSGWHMSTEIDLNDVFGFTWNGRLRCAKVPAAEMIRLGELVRAAGNFDRILLTPGRTRHLTADIIPLVDISYLRDLDQRFSYHRLSVEPEWDIPEMDGRHNRAAVTRLVRDEIDAELERYAEGAEELRATAIHRVRRHRAEPIVLTRGIG